MNAEAALNLYMSDHQYSRTGGRRGIEGRYQSTTPHVHIVAFPRPACMYICMYIDIYEYNCTIKIQELHRGGANKYTQTCMNACLYVCMYYGWMGGWATLPSRSRNWREERRRSPSINHDMPCDPSLLSENIRMNMEHKIHSKKE